MKLKGIELETLTNWCLWKEERQEEEEDDVEWRRKELLELRLP